MLGFEVGFVVVFADFAAGVAELFTLAFGFGALALTTTGTLMTLPALNWEGVMLLMSNISSSVVLYRAAKFERESPFTIL